MNTLSREQVEGIGRHLREENLAGVAGKILAHDAALREQLAAVEKRAAEDRIIMAMGGNQTEYYANKLATTQQNLEDNGVLYRTLLAEKLDVDAKLAAMTQERDEYKRKYELVRHDAAYQECCTLREKAEKERDSLREQLAAAHEQLRLCNIDQLNTQAELAAMTQELATVNRDAAHWFQVARNHEDTCTSAVLQQRVTALSTALATLIREASRVADDHHRPRYTRLDESILSAKEALAPTPRGEEET